HRDAGGTDRASRRPLERSAGTKPARAINAEKTTLVAGPVVEPEPRVIQADTVVRAAGLSARYDLGRQDQRGLQLIRCDAVGLQLGSANRIVVDLRLGDRIRGNDPRVHALRDEDLAIDAFEHRAGNK